MRSSIRLLGYFIWEVYDRQGRIRCRRSFSNGITTVGLNGILDGYFRAGGVITPYLGLIDNASYSAVAAADTMSSHSGWTEITAYTQSTRPAWSPDASSSGVISNGTAAVFTFNATKTVKGAFVTSNDTKGGTTGTLWSTGVADATQQLESGESLRLIYELTGSSN